MKQSSSTSSSTISNHLASLEESAVFTVDSAKELRLLIYSLDTAVAGLSLPAGVADKITEIRKASDFPASDRWLQKFNRLR